uniref:Thyroglobulin type-1 domain-containing protein n=1 Tax=Callorhinchus milii TaxID=7868 RepID=A0A4W3H568_CALMI
PGSVDTQCRGSVTESLTLTWECGRTVLREVCSVADLGVHCASCSHPLCISRFSPGTGPAGCEVRARGLLHAAEMESPPQCSPDGHYLPVQCRLINSTDGTTINRFLSTFHTFHDSRQMLTDVSGFCYCVDALGREQQ